MFNRLIIIVFLAFFSFDANAKTRSLIIQSQQSQHQLQVEIADNPETWERGLMFRRQLAEDHGMLFIFPREIIAQFWMKNTLIPLDMLFIDKKGKIIKIEKNAKPNSLSVISSGRATKAVLEINAGISEKLNIQTGDKVLYDVFEN